MGGCLCSRFVRGLCIAGVEEAYHSDKCNLLTVEEGQECDEALATKMNKTRSNAQHKAAHKDRAATGPTRTPVFAGHARQAGTCHFVPDRRLQLQAGQGHRLTDQRHPAPSINQGT